MDSAVVAMNAASSSSSASYLSKLTNPNSTISLSRPSFTSFKPLKSLHTPSPDLKFSSRNPSSSFSCFAVTISPSQTSDQSDTRLQLLVSEFQSLADPIDRVKRLLHYANLLPPFDDSLKVTDNRVMGCTAQVWLAARMDGEGRMRFLVDSDSEITKGFCSCLISVLDGAAPEEVLALSTDDLGDLSVVGVHGRVESRVNTWHNVLISMQKRTKAIVAQKQGRSPGEPFPSLVVTADGIQAKGSYAEAQVFTGGVNFLRSCASKGFWNATLDDH